MSESTTKRTLGLVGLGRMGANMARRIASRGHQVIAWDRDSRVVASLQDEGISPARDLSHLVQQLPRPRAVWLMLPAGVTAKVASQLADLLEPGDVLIDGGNSRYTEAVDRAAALKKRGIHHVDVGTSGGIHGLERGYCLMVGGDEDAVARIEPVLSALAPGSAGVARTKGRSGDHSTEEMGYLHCGPPGAGHFVKMVHNGIEYGLMAAYAEGFNVLRHAGVGRDESEVDAETTPLRDAKYYQYEFELDRIAELWRRGSVIPSWLLDLTAEALNTSPELTDFSGRVSDSGEGRWTQIAAIEEGVPAHVLSAALLDRFQSRGRGEFAAKVLSAMRLGFGGHQEKSE